MSTKTIEAMLASPPERDELVVQLFHRDGGQWGEIYRDKGTYLIEFYVPEKEGTLRLEACELVIVLNKVLAALRERLEGA